MDNWLTAALAALILYGLWGFFPKLAMIGLTPVSALVYEVAGAALVGMAALVMTGFKPEVEARGMLFAGLTGVCGMLGTLCFFHAVSRGPVTVVVSLTALYPLVAILLAAVFLHEPVTLRQALAMVLALAAILLFATE